MSDEFDYIVVGAGTSGCALVGSLAAALPAARVALVEAGGDATAATVWEPQRWPYNFSRECDFDYQTVPQPELKMRQIQYPRGCGLGGSSLINVMLYSRGYKADWDKMPGGWQSQDVEPVFEGIEGRLHLSEISAHDFGHAAAAAAEACGIKRCQEGKWEAHGSLTAYRATIDSRTGRRIDIYRAFGADRGNVTVIRGSVERILVDKRSSRATGVRLCAGRERKELRVRSQGEVVVCAGAIDTPKLLQLSGIGPAEVLQKFGIDQICSLPVGQGLQDHTLFPMASLAKPTPCLKDLAPNSVQGWINDEPNGVQICFIDGTATSDIIPFGLMAPATAPGLRSAIMRCFVRAASLLFRSAVACFPGLKRQLARTIGLNVCLVRPTSVGTVTIRSTDCTVPPAIDPNFLSTEHDQRAFKSGIATVRKLVATSPLKDMIAKDLSMIPDNDDMNSQLTTGAYYHPTGTCSMGKCVDSELRILGLSGLRVADASVLPVHPRAPTQAACMVIGARCAEFLARDAKSH